MKIGYACINSTLQTAGGVTTNRGMRQKTYNEKGLDYVSELALQNCRDLVTIVKWNEENGINKINIHVGGAYGDKQSTLDRWCDNFYKLKDNTRSRLTIENDDKANMYSVVELVEGIFKRTGVPVVFDYYHHKFCTGDLTEQEALELAASTWPEGIVPCTHYSESRRKEHLDESIRAQAHSDLINGPIETYGNDIDVVIEAKHKELAVLGYGS